MAGTGVNGSGKRVTVTRARELRFIRKISPRPMPEENRRIAESLLADFVARLYIEEHPELFRRRTPIGTPGTADASKAEPVRGGTWPRDAAQAGQGSQSGETQTQTDDQKESRA